MFCCLRFLLAGWLWGGGVPLLPGSPAQTATLQVLETSCLPGPFIGSNDFLLSQALGYHTIPCCFPQILITPLEVFFYFLNSPQLSSLSAICFLLGPWLIHIATLS
jgi:hypothetical protein